MLVARLARVIAEEEGGDGDLAYVLGLLHDAGKLRARELEVADDEATVKLVEEKLEELGDHPLLRRALEALREGRSVEALAVHDADYLSKAGILGLATFFSKWSVKGLTVDEAVLTKLSREMTILSNLELHLATGYAKKLGRELARKALRAYAELLKELRLQGVAVRVRRRRVRGYRVVVVAPELCPSCGGRVNLTRGAVGEGRACVEYRVRASCERCGWSADESVCILETASDRWACGSGPKG